MRPQLRAREAVFAGRAWTAAMNRAKRPIAKAYDGEGNAPLVLRDKSGVWSFGLLWFHWSMEEPVWWSDMFGIIVPTGYLLPDEIISKLEEEQ